MRYTQQKQIERQREKLLKQCKIGAASLLGTVLADPRFIVNI